MILLTLQLQNLHSQALAFIRSVASIGPTVTQAVAKNKENSSLEDRIIIGSIPVCLHPDCKGWIVDSFAGKYWIRCDDPKHSHLSSHIDIGVDVSGDAYTKNDDNKLIAKNREAQASI